MLLQIIFLQKKKDSLPKRIQLLFIDLVGLAHFRLVGWFHKLLQRLTFQKRLWARS